MKIKRMRLRVAMISFAVFVLSGLVGFPGIQTNTNSGNVSAETESENCDVVIAESSDELVYVNSDATQPAFVLSPYEYNFKEMLYTQGEIHKLGYNYSLSDLSIYQTLQETVDILDYATKPLLSMMQITDSEYNDITDNTDENYEVEDSLIEESVEEEIIEKESIDQLAEIAAKVIFKCETSAEYDKELQIEHYTAINPNDNGSLSIGLLQWHGPRAKKLLQRIYEADPVLFDTVLENNGAKSLKQDVLDDSKWTRYRLRRNGYYYNAIKELLGTEIGIKVQDELALIDVKGYLKIGIEDYGITKPQSLIYFADLANQYGVYDDVVKRILRKAGSKGSKTLDNLYESTKSVTTKYRERRHIVYSTINNIMNELPSIKDYIDKLDNE